MKIVKKILPILGFLFFVMIIFFSFILLNRNKYGVFELNNKLYVNISSNNSSKTYKKGSLVILNKTTLNDLKENDDVFLYKENSKTKALQLISSKVKEIDKERNAIIATHDGMYYTEDFIAGKPYKVVPFWGGFFDLVLSKWFFLIFILVPAFAIVVYEIYLLFIQIKYGDDEDEEDKMLDDKNDKKEEKLDNKKPDEKKGEQQPQPVQQPIKPNQPVTQQPLQQPIQQPAQPSQPVQSTQPKEEAEVLSVDVELLDGINNELKVDKKIPTEETTEEPSEDEKKK